MTSTAQALFGNVPQTDPIGFFKGTQPDYKKAVDFLKFRKEDVSVATNVPKSSVRYDKKIPKELQERIQEWAIAINLVASYFNNQEKTMLWFQMPNPMLGSIAPKDMIRLGRFKKLYKFIQTALDENQAE